MYTDASIDTLLHNVVPISMNSLHSVYTSLLSRCTLLNFESLSLIDVVRASMLTPLE